MAYLTPIGVEAVADASVSELLAHWIAEQQQRDGLCLRERPRIGILAAQSHLRDGGWPSYSGDAPTVQAILEAGGFPCLIPTLPSIGHIWMRYCPCITRPWKSWRLAWRLPPCLLTE